MKRLIVDLSSLCWTSLYAGKDEENFRDVELNGRTVRINSWQHGYENAINSLVSAWEKNGIRPCDTILVKETGNSTGMRKRILPTYKEKRDANRPKEYYEEFNALQDKLISELAKVGASTVTRPHAEADDVIAYLALKLHGKKVIWSRDKDLAALLSDDVALWADNDLITENPYGPWPVEWIPVYKGLVGDPSDKIPGAKGFGDKAWLNLISIFGAEAIPTVENLIQTKTLDELQENVADLKVLGKVIEHQEDVYKSYAAGKLYPDQCENMRQPLQWSPSYVHPRSEIQDERLRPYGGAIRLVHADNYEEAVKWATPLIQASKEVSLDIETSMPDEAIEWLQAIKGTDKEEGIGVDVLTSELNGLALTFGPNSQYTLYFTCGHVETDEHKNVTTDQIRDVVAKIPGDIPIVVQNNSFEMPILYQLWGEDWKDNGWHGFLPNCHDTKILANYVNENISTGLKQSSKHYFGYDQVSYEEVTQGRKMDQMTAAEVLHYGADDTIMTAALYNHYRTICEIEGSWNTYLEVEVKPAYVTALAFVQGTNFSLETMLDFKREDEANAEKYQKTIDDFLIKLGWEGTVCPEYTAEDLEVPAKIKEIYKVITGEDFKTMVRTPNKLYKLMATLDHEDAPLLAKFLEEGNLDQVNDWVQSRFDGRPELNLGSPKQVRNLLYERLKAPVRIINPLTQNERENKQDLANACYKFNKILRGSETVDPLTDEEQVLLIQKASTDDTAFQYALKEDWDEETRAFLTAIVELKKINTRHSLFYNKYVNLRHWKTNRIHAYAHQCGTVTRRYSYSDPNLQQLPKRGEGRRFRQAFVPHHRKAVICSMDFSGQELRLGAELSGDKAMIACYVGEHLLDIHSLVAAAAMKLMWETEYIDNLVEKYEIDKSDPEWEYRLFIHLREHGTEDEKDKADALRDQAKDVNFGSAYGAEAPTVAKSLFITISEAQGILDSRFETFPEFEKWKEQVISDLQTKGYAELPSGARRHLAHVMAEGDKWERQRAERQGPNFMIQGAAAEQTKRAMAALWDSGALFRYDVRFIAPVHDELLTSVAVEDAHEFIKIKHQCMTQKFMEIVPEVADISVGPNFGVQYECGNEYDYDKVQAALDKCFELEAA